jgi:hypothetical protein
MLKGVNSLVVALAMVSSAWLSPDVIVSTLLALLALFAFFALVLLFTLFAFFVALLSSRAIVVVAVAIIEKTTYW